MKRNNGGVTIENTQASSYGVEGWMDETKVTSTTTTYT